MKTLIKRIFLIVGLLLSCACNFVVCSLVVCNNYPPSTALTPPVELKDTGYIAFISQMDGQPDIYLIRTDDLTITRLTNTPDREFNLSWSPDGAKLTYVLDRGNTADLYVMNADGTDNKKLLEAESGQISPDGTQLIYIDKKEGDYEIFLSSLDGTQDINLTNSPAWEGQAAWSPDGKQIAFSSNREGDDDIFVMNADGSNVSQITSLQDHQILPMWSPDGMQIVFASKHEESAATFTL